MTNVTTTYGGIEIVYNEDENKWVFELHGRERKMDSLTQAKEAIDRSVAEKSEPFQRVPIWVWEYIGEPKQGMITSIAGTSYQRGVYYWVVVDGQRRKMSQDSCFPDTPETLAAIRKWRLFSDAESKAAKGAREIKDGLKPVQLK